MTERRLHVPSLEGDVIPLGAQAAHHARVLRLAAGDAVTLFDGRGGEADAILEPDDRARVVAKRDAPAEPRVILVQAVPKGSKLDEIVRAATECGATEIHLAITERTIARDKSAAHLERLARIATEAARQSERATVPVIVPPAPLAEVAGRAPSDAVRLALSAREGAAWREAIAGAREVWCVVGPEGGLSESEETTLEGAGWTLARLALPVLRVETAAPVAVALITDALRSR